MHFAPPPPFSYTHTVFPADILRATAHPLRPQVFYTEGTEELRRARLWVLQYSIPRARARVQLAKRKQADLDRYIAVKQAERGGGRKKESGKPKI